ncbi:class I SAM-dependent methyltransferase [bacterium]|jgi:tRNA (cmo5U34)-methyltransferase|nr:class I SAM-dependent methyltransferase [Planctomicrobium sp.]MDB4731535.1 class I SAM-dependent methyltransferase [bacterium]
MSDRRKSSVEEIRSRFDQDVERFSNLETGQSATVDAALSLDLIANAAVKVSPHASSLLDLGCGAGNFSMRLLQLPNQIADVTLIDLSQPMLDRAKLRISESTQIQPRVFQTDLRDFRFEDDRYDIILAGAVLHHLRTDQEWELVFQNVYDSLRPGGSFWVFDLVCYNHASVQQLMWERYGRYLSELKDEAYRDHVFQYIEIEDTPRPLFYQLNLLNQSGFADIEVLHSNSCFAAFGAAKPLK